MFTRQMNVKKLPVKKTEDLVPSKPQKGGLVIPEYDFHYKQVLDQIKKIKNASKRWYFEQGLKEMDARYGAGTLSILNWNIYRAHVAATLTSQIHENRNNPQSIQNTRNMFANQTWKEVFNRI